jgi:hypothetical protein
VDGFIKDLLVVLEVHYVKREEKSSLEENFLLHFTVVAGVVEWYTRSTQNRMPQGLWVQVPSPAQRKMLPDFSGGILCLRMGLESRNKVRQGRERHIFKEPATIKIVDS